MGTFKIDLLGMSASATGDLAIVALTVIALAVIALRFHAQFRRKS